MRSSKLTLIKGKVLINSFLPAWVPMCPPSCLFIYVCQLPGVWVSISPCPYSSPEWSGLVCCGVVNAWTRHASLPAISSNCIFPLYIRQSRSSHHHRLSYLFIPLRALCRWYVKIHHSLSLIFLSLLNILNLFLLLNPCLSPLLSHL